MTVWLSPPQTETWPRWLPAPRSTDPHTHLCRSLASVGLCGAETMWARAGHQATTRPRCPDCERLVS